MPGEAKIYDRDVLEAYRDLRLRERIRFFFETHADECIDSSFCFTRPPGEIVQFEEGEPLRARKQAQKRRLARYGL